MCLIIYKPNATDTVPSDYIQNAQTINKDGFGITYLDNFKTHKTMNYNHARKLISAKRPFVAHYRYTTRGATNRKSCHPYRINKNTMLYSNGTVADLGSDTTTDTAIVADMMSKMPRKYWHKLMSMTDVRFAIVNRDGTVSRAGKWHERDGIYYSKANCFHKPYTPPTRTIGYNNAGYWRKTESSSYTRQKPKLVASQHTTRAWDDYDHYDDYYYDNYSLSPTNKTEYDMSFQGNNYIAVYGTLKSNKGNHTYYLSTSTLVGIGKTVLKYPMTGAGLPYVYNQPNVGHNIQVEVYDVANKMDRENIDSLERHPSWYTRHQTDIELTSGRVVKAWMYFMDEVDLTLKQNELIQCY